MNKDMCDVFEELQHKNISKIKNKDKLWLCTDRKLSNVTLSGALMADMDILLSFSMVFFTLLEEEIMQEITQLICSDMI